MVENKYPELPVIPYQKVAVPASDILSLIRSYPYPKEVKKTVYSICYEESGGFKSFVNTNGAGIQADNARWSKKWDSFIVGTTVISENMTGNSRRFLVFKDWRDSINMLAYYVNDRGIYVGGNSAGWANINPVGDARLVNNQILQVDLYTTYYRAWVIGDNKARPKFDDIADFTKVYNTTADLF